MKRNIKRIISFVLSLALVLPMIASVSAANGYDRGYDGGMPGDGIIYAHGLDLSSWDGDSLNFYDLKAAGFNYVILRCGTSYGKDSYFETYYSQAKAAGIDVGVYYYSYANTVSEAYTDATNTLSWIAGKKFEYPIYFDFEDPSAQGGLSDSACIDICYKYMNTIKDAGYLTGMYSMASWLKQGWVKSSGIYDYYEGWVAHYVSGSYNGGYDTYSPTYCTQFGMYQYTANLYFTVNGRTYGDYDANVCYKDYPAIVKRYGFNGYESVGKWEQDSIGWRYKKDDRYLSGWQVIDNETYYFGGGDYMYTGWLNENGNYYFFNPANGIMQRGWIAVDDKWYYANGDGVMQTGWIQPEEGGDWYYMNEDGSMATGWIMPDGVTTYYMDPESGKMMVDWVLIDGAWHEFSHWGVYYHNKSVTVGDRFVAKISSNMNSSKFVTSIGYDAVINKDLGGQENLWEFELQEDQTYKITNIASGWCLDVQDGKDDIGTNIQTWEDIGGNPQRWILTDDENDGTYTLRPVSGFHNDNVMDVINADDTDGNDIVISTYNGGSNQRFDIQKLRLGDVDGNGSVNIRDVTRLQKMLTGEYSAANMETVADVSGNGDVDVRDATYIQMALSWIITRFPVETM